MADLRDLAKRLNTHADELDSVASKVAAEFALVLIERLVDSTPIDTSKAISNWILSINDPVLIDQDAFAEGIRGSTYQASKAEVMNFARTQIAKKQAGEPIFLSNAAPYIRSLEEGSSSQAPAGFLRQSVMFARKQLPTLIKKVIKDGR